MTDRTVTLGDLVDASSEIRDFLSQKTVLRLPNSNNIEVKGQTYEVRLFTFYLPKALPDVKTFQDFVIHKGLRDQPLKAEQRPGGLDILSYNMYNEGTYILISLMPL